MGSGKGRIGSRCDVRSLTCTFVCLTVLVIQDKVSLELDLSDEYQYYRFAHAYTRSQVLKYFKRWPKGVGLMGLVTSGNGFRLSGQNEYFFAQDDTSQAGLS